MTLYICDIRELADLPGMELLDRRRRERVHRYRRPEDQARCLAAGLLLRSVLGEERVSRVFLSEHGKPVLPEGPSFNLSHSGSKVVLLADDGPVGVDVEQMAPFSPAVAGKVFTAAEQSWLSRRWEDGAFFRLWTGKEAVMKAVGLGFRLPPDRFEICPDAGTACLESGQVWYLHWIDLEQHMLCTAAEHPGGPGTPVFLSGDDLLQKDGRGMF